MFGIRAGLSQAARTAAKTPAAKSGAGGFFGAIGGRVAYKNAGARVGGITKTSGAAAAKQKQLVKEAVKMAQKGTTTVKGINDAMKWAKKQVSIPETLKDTGEAVGEAVAAPVLGMLKKLLLPAAVILVGWHLVKKYVL